MCREGDAMNLVPTFAWFTHFKWHVPRRSSPPDFADMGTAFGLDASLDSEPAVLPVETAAAAQKKGRPVPGAPQQQPLRGNARARR
jgi:hypothetical protein